MTFLAENDPGLDPRARELIRIGHVAIASEDDDALDGFFAQDFLFHGAAGDMDLAQTKAFFAVLRATFSNFRCERRHIAVDGDFVGCLTTMSGRFVNPIDLPPVGTIQPTGSDVSFDLVNLFRYNEAGELAEEWARYDTLGLMTQLGVDTIGLLGSA